MSIEDYLVLEIESSFHLKADVRGNIAFIWQPGYIATGHNFSFDYDKPLSVLASELVAEHYEHDTGELRGDE